MSTATAGSSASVSLLTRCGRFFFHYRNQVFPLALLLLFAGFRPVYPRGSERLDNWLDALGIGVALIGQALRFAVIGYAYIIRGGKNKQVYADKLVTEGFFRHSRNPLYVGNLIVLLGLFIVHINPWVCALGLPFFLFAYSAIVAAEEAYLRGKFGAEYDEYCRRVNRWLLDFRGLRETMRSMQFAWRRVIVKEYGSTYAWCTAALLLMGYDTLVYHRYAERAAYINTLATLGVIATVAWLTIRWLKQSRRLKGE